MNTNELPALPKSYSAARELGLDDLYTAEQMHAYVMADRERQAGEAVAYTQSQRSTAYDMLDRKLRNTLDDADYAEMSGALECLFAAPSPDGKAEQAEAPLLDVDAYQRKYANVIHLNDDMRYGYECLYNEIRSGLQRTTQPTASNAGERATADTLSFICTNGCGYCGVKLRDFVTHATQAQDSDTWVTVASEPEIVSTCCGHPVEVWDERKQDVVAEVRAALASKPPAGEQKPVGFMSEQQIPAIKDQDGEGGCYIPMRKTPAGLFTFALYGAPQPEQVAQDGERLVWAMNHMHMPEHGKAYFHHVLSIGGMGDLSDCRVFVDNAIRTARARGEGGAKT